MDPVRGARNKAVSDPKKRVFGVTVDWKVGENEWIRTDDIKKDSGITEYKLWEENSPDGRYTLVFRTEKKEYSYGFYDQSGENHDSDTKVATEHRVPYDSEKPTVLYINGGQY